MAYKNISLSSSVICMDFLNLKKDLIKMQELEIDYFHFDICDSLFVSEFGLPFSMVQKILETKSNFKKPVSHYHLMVEEPKRIFEFIPKEKDAIVHLHYEACRNLHRELIFLKKLGFRPGLVLNPATPLDCIEYVVEEVSSIVIMTVNPGSSGQKIVPQTLKKIEKLREWRDRLGYQFEIVVDGNVSFENIPLMVELGADVLVLGTSGLFIKEMSFDESYEKLKASIDLGLKKR